MRQVAALGSRHHLLLDIRGGVWFCDALNPAAPVPVAGAPAGVRSLSASSTHCLLLTGTGEVWSGAAAIGSAPGVLWSKRNTTPALGRRRSQMRQAS